ncbi:MAG TPA: hypothetical protein VK932_27045 [Kofleriaceae bacterium]|nr:hypothetical protein [Kofleriaceae bacterium]
MRIIALLFVSLMSVSCAVDEVDESSEVQSLGAGCTLYRPIGWWGNGAFCVESQSTPLSMVDGQYYTGGSGGPGSTGYGYVTVRCNNGWIAEIASSCQPGIEP